MPKRLPKRLRTFIGSMAILIFVCVYALVAMALAESRILEAPKLVQTIAYMLLGIIWIFPVMPMIRWMERPERL
jgi:ABC-type Na+ efflux pump permease subunit